MTLFRPTWRFLLAIVFAAIGEWLERVGGEPPEPPPPSNRPQIRWE